MFSMFLTSLRISFMTIFITGVMYPMLVTGIGQIIFPNQANGSIVQDAHGRKVGSSLIGQNFEYPEYFHSRPSAAGENGYDASASSGSNLGPSSKKLKDRVTQEMDHLQKENMQTETAIPVELVTTSGSGLDPHISYISANWQVPRIAKCRQIDPERIKNILAEMMEGKDLGILGEARVNVLELNLALDKHFGRLHPEQ